MFMSLACQPAAVLLLLILSLLLLLHLGSDTSSVAAFSKKVAAGNSKHLLKSHQKLIRNRLLSSGTEEEDEYDDETTDDFVDETTTAKASRRGEDGGDHLPKKSPLELFQSLKVTILGPTSTAEKLVALDKILASTDPGLEIMRQKAATYKQALQTLQKVQRGGAAAGVPGGGKSLKQAKADVKVARFQLKNTWQRLASMPANLLPDSKWGWGGSALLLAGLLGNHQYRKWIENNARLHGSNVRGGQHPPGNVFPYGDLAKGEGAPPPLATLPSQSDADSLFLVGATAAILLLLCVCCCGGAFLLFYDKLNLAGSRGAAAEVAGGGGNEGSSATGNRASNRSSHRRTTL